MSMFGEADETTEAGRDHQGVAAQMLTAFNDHDLAALAALSPAGRNDHVEVRHTLHEYLDSLWQVSAAAQPPLEASELAAIAAMRDLTGALWSNAVNAAHLAGDPEDRS